MTQQTLTSISIASGTEDTALLYSFSTLKQRANESAGATAFKLTSLGSGTLEYSPDAGVSWIALTAADITAGVWYSTAGVTVGANTYAGSLRYTGAPNANGTATMFTARASSAVGIDADLSSTDVAAKVTLTAVQDSPTGSVLITANTAAIAIGTKLTASNTLADADGMGAVSYRWQSSSDGITWGDITGATANQFIVTAGQPSGSHIRVVASYGDGMGMYNEVSSQDISVSQFVAVQAVQVFTGAAWVNATAIRRWDGTQWVDVPLSALRAVP